MYAFKLLPLFQSEQGILRTKLESVIEENRSLSEQLQSEIKKNSSSDNYVKSLRSNVNLQLEAAIQVCLLIKKIIF